MEDTLIVIVVIGVAAILMFVFPVMTMSDRSDDMVELAVRTAVTEFVDAVRATGKLTADDYDVFVVTIGSTGNTYDIEMEAKILDENPGKKTTQVQANKIGENVYYSKYTSQLLDELYTEDGKKRTISFKEGDYFSVKVKNTNTTLSQQFKNFFYIVTGNDTYTIAAQHGGLITANGTN